MINFRSIEIFWDIFKQLFLFQDLLLPWSFSGILLKLETENE